MSTTKFAKAIISIEKQQFKPGDICVIRFSQFRMTFEDSRDMNASLARVPSLKGVFIITLPDHITLEKLDEEVMNDVGWFKGEPKKKIQNEPA